VSQFCSASVHELPRDQRTTTNRFRHSFPQPLQRSLSDHQHFEALNCTRKAARRSAKFATLPGCVAAVLATDHCRTSSRNLHVLPAIMPIVVSPMIIWPMPVGLVFSRSTIQAQSFRIFLHRIRQTPYPAERTVPEAVELIWDETCLALDVRAVECTLFTFQFRNIHTFSSQAMISIYSLPSGYSGLMLSLFGTITGTLS